jgi:uncharacterized membrane protein YgcG
MRYLFIFILFFSSFAQADTTYSVTGTGPFAGYSSLTVPVYGASANLACMRALPVAIAAIGDNYWGPASVTGGNCYFGSQLYGVIHTEACPDGQIISSVSKTCQPVCPQDFTITTDDPLCTPPPACEKDKSDGFVNILNTTGVSVPTYCSGTCQFNYVWSNEQTNCYYYLDAPSQHYCNYEKIENGQSCTSSNLGSVDSNTSGSGTNPVDPGTGGTGGNTGGTGGNTGGTGGDTGGTGGDTGGTGGTGGTSGGTGGTGGNTGGTSGAYGGPSAGQIGSAVAGAMSSLFGANPNAFNAAPSGESVASRDAADSAISDAVSGWAAFDPANSAKDNFRNITSDWFAVIPSDGCSSLSAHIGPYLWTIDPCPTASRISEIASYAMWLYFSVSVFALVLGRAE